MGCLLQKLSRGRLRLVLYEKGITGPITWVQIQTHGLFLRQSVVLKLREWGIGESYKYVFVLLIEFGVGGWTGLELQLSSEKQHEV